MTFLVPNGARTSTRVSPRKVPYRLRGGQLQSDVEG